MLGARTRGALVAVCSFFLPGLGQAFLRKWLRAVFFAGMFVLTVVVFAPDSVFAAEGGLDGALAAAEQASREVSTTGTVALTVVQFGAMMDAYVQAVSGHASTDATGPTCPNCGREIEPTHGFCHWCTYEFEEPPETTPENASEPPQ